MTGENEEFSISIEDLMSRHFPKAELARRAYEKIKSKKEPVSMLRESITNNKAALLPPDAAGIYVFFLNSKPLRVGQTTSLLDRIQAHLGLKLTDTIKLGASSLRTRLMKALGYLDEPEEKWKPRIDGFLDKTEFGWVEIRFGRIELEEEIEETMILMPEFPKKWGEKGTPKYQNRCKEIGKLIGPLWEDFKNPDCFPSSS